jgi:hypothetical protein
MAVNKKYFYVYYSYEPWGRGYIGKRECWCLPEEDNKYFGSYSDKTFKPTKKIILEIFDTVEEAFAAEIKLQEFYEVDKNPHFANIYIHRSKNFCNNGSKIIRKKISNALMGIKRSEETKRKVSEAKKGTILSEETRKKLSEARKRNPTSSMLGKTHTEYWKHEHSKRMLKNNPFKGKKHTEETKKIISEKAKGRVAPNKGKPHSEETKRKIREKRKQQCVVKKLQQQSGGN